MATLHVLPNMTYGGRPYGLIENVVTEKDHRGQGHGRAVIGRLAEAARAAGCYKLMLLTGQARNARGFYEAVGFSADAKWGMMMRFVEPAQASGSETGSGSVRA
jgi:Acetyltransferases